MPHQRIDRVRELIKEEVSRIVQGELRDPRIGMVTITDAEVSADLRHARMYFTVLGDDRARQECQEGLASASKFIRGEIARRVQLKYIPEIVFEFDSSLDHAMRVEELLNQIHSSPADASAPLEDNSSSSEPTDL